MRHYLPDKKTLDEAWRRWQRGETDENQHGPLLPRPRPVLCFRCGAELGTVRYRLLVNGLWKPVGPECRKYYPVGNIRTIDPTEEKTGEKPVSPRGGPVDP